MNAASAGGSGAGGSTQVESVHVSFTGEADSYVKAGKDAVNALDKVDNAAEQLDKQLDKLGDEAIDTGRDIGKLDQSLDAAGKAITTAADKARKLDERLISLGRNMALKVTLPVVAFKTASVLSFSAFDGAMKSSMAIMDNLTAVQETAMGKQAIDMSMATATSARGLAASYLYLASAGLSVEQTFLALPIVEKFATAGAFDMEVATTLLADAQSALGLAMGSTQERMANMLMLSDRLVMANNIANASVEQFSTSLTSEAGSAMKNYNISLDEGLAVLSAYADQGVKAELAGHSYGRVLRLLAAAAHANAEEHAAFGLEVFDSTGAMNSMSVIVGQLEKGFEGMSVKQKTAMLTQLGFKSLSQQVILPLVGTSKAIETYRNRLVEAGGVTQRVADKQLSSFPNQMAITRNHITAVMIDIGSRLAPGMLMIGDVVRSASKHWLQMNGAVRSSIVTLAGVAATIGPAAIAVGTLIQVNAWAAGGYVLLGTKATWAVGKIRSATMVLVASSRAARIAALAFFVNPVTLGVVAGVLAVGAAIAGVIRLVGGPGSLSAVWGSVKEAVMNTFNVAKEAVTGFIANWDANMAALWEAAVFNWENLGSVIGSMLTAAASNVAVVIDTMIQLWSAYLGWCSVQLPGIFINIFQVQIPQAVLKGLGVVLGLAHDVSMEFGTTFITIAATVNQAILSISLVATKVFTGLISQAQKVWDALKSGKVAEALSVMTVQTAAVLKKAVEDEAMKVTLLATQAAARIAGAYDKYKKKTIANYDRGAKNPDFMQTAGEILNEGAGRLTNPLGKMKLPSFKFHQPKLPVATAKVDADVSPAATAVRNMRRELEDNPITMSVGVQALAATSAEAMVLARNQWSQRRAEHLANREDTKAEAAATPQAIARQATKDGIKLEPMKHDATQVVTYGSASTPLPTLNYQGPALTAPAAMVPNFMSPVQPAQRPPAQYVTKQPTPSFIPTLPAPAATPTLPTLAGLGQIAMAPFAGVADVVSTVTSPQSVPVAATLPVPSLPQAQADLTPAVSTITSLLTAPIEMMTSTWGSVAAATATLTEGVAGASSYATTTPSTPETTPPSLVTSPPATADYDSNMFRSTMLLLTKQIAANTSVKPASAAVTLAPANLRKS